MAKLKLEIVTPEGRAYQDDVDMVVLPGSDGELGVYPAHAPLMTQLAPGEPKMQSIARKPLLRTRILHLTN